MGHIYYSRGSGAKLAVLLFSNARSVPTSKQCPSLQARGNHKNEKGHSFEVFFRIKKMTRKCLSCGTPLRFFAAESHGCDG